MFELAAFLLTESGAYVRPELRAALYRMVADMPDIELLGEVDDEVGRAGIGVGYRVPTSAGFSLGAVEGFPSGPMRHEVIFDPATSVVLGERYVYTGSGTAVSWVVYLESGVVDGPSKDI